MAVIALDLGGTKLAGALFSETGELLARRITRVEGRTAAAVGALVAAEARALLALGEGRAVAGLGVSVPGIYHVRTGSVWAPNLPGWTDYPLLEELEAAVPGVPVRVESDRACSILGETWRGGARQCRNAVFVAVGTGIGAGLLVDGRLLRGHGDIAGATGWMALDRSYRPGYAGCGCFEYHASGPGIARTARRLLAEEPSATSLLRDRDADTLTAADVFEAEAAGDALAARIVADAVACWGMATANYVSLFNPERIIFGGGVFGPAARFLDRIYEEACRWAQPVSIRQVTLAASRLGPDAALYGAARLALGSAGDEP